MPQISPINWISIVLFLVLVLLITLSILPNLSLNEPNNIQLNASNNNLPW